MSMLSYCNSMYFNSPYLPYSISPTELDRENPHSPPHLISHGEKNGAICVLLAMRSEVADRVCATPNEDAT